MQYTYDFRHPAVRDLAWVMRSPSLVIACRDAASEFISDEYCASVYESNTDWLQQLDRSPADLLEFLSRRPCSRLGYYFEDLVAYWLKQRISDGYFESHIKVSENNRDVGEFDFLFRHNNCYFHWETAVKFYLYWRNNSAKVTWFGPNANDTLEKKLDKLLSHQIRMSELAESKTILQNRGIEVANLDAGIFLKGYLFYPLEQDLADIKFMAAKCQISPDHLTGWWVSVDKLSDSVFEALSGDSLGWQTLPRRKWLAPQVYHPDEASKRLQSNLEVVESLQKHFRESGESRMIAGYAADSEGCWREQTRGFVVSQNWPA